MSRRRLLTRSLKTAGALGVGRAVLPFTAPLGASMLAGCRAPARAAGIGGRLIDPGLRLGHRLRDLDMNSLHDVVTRPLETGGTLFDVVIVGGGVAGLSAAWRLKHAGLQKVCLLELDDVVGGTARSDESAVTAYPWAAHYVTAPLAHSTLMIRLLTELDALDGVDEHGHPMPREEVGVREPEERLYADGQFFEGLLPEALCDEHDRAEFQRFSELMDHYAGLRDGAGRPAFAIPRALCSQDPDLLALDAISFRTFLVQQGFTSPLLFWLCDYAVRDDDGVDLDEASAWVGLFYFCARRVPGLPERTVMTWPEGNGRLVRHLREHGIDDVRVGQAVIDVRRRQFDTSSGDEVVAITCLGDDGGPQTLLARQAIVCAPEHVRRRLLGQREPPRDVGAMTTSAWAVANVHLRDRPQTIPRLPFPRATGAEQVPFAWDTVFFGADSLGYVSATHQSGRDHGPTVLTWYQPLTGQDPAEARRALLASTHADWAQRCLDDLRRAHDDIDDLVEAVDVCRWGHAMTRPVPGTFSDGRLDHASRSVDGCIHQAHSDCSGMALFEESLHHGVRAAELALRGLGVPSPSFLESPLLPAGSNDLAPLDQR